MNRIKDILSFKLIALIALVFVFVMGSCTKSELNDVNKANEQIELKKIESSPLGIGDNGGDDDQDKDDSIGDNGGDDDQDKDDKSRVKIF